MFDTEQEIPLLKQEETTETNVAMRSQSLIKKDSLLPKIKRLQKSVKKLQKNTTVNKIPEFTITSKNPKQINMLTKPIEEKINNVKTNLT